MRMEHSENFKAVLEEKTRETESIIVAYLPKEEGFAKEQRAERGFVRCFCRRVSVCSAEPGRQ